MVRAPTAPGSDGYAHGVPGKFDGSPDLSSILSAAEKVVTDKPQPGQVGVTGIGTPPSHW